jgi:putative transposase
MLSIIVGVAAVICDCLRWLSLTLRSTSAVEAENLFLRRQLALYVECGVKPRRIDSITRIALQQLREAVGFEERYAYLLHDRDSIFAQHLDDSIGRLGVTVLKSPPRSPMANANCERVIGTIRRECVDWVIPLSEHHLRRILKSWIRHYNHGRPHMSLGPGIPGSPAITTVPAPSSRHRRGEAYAIRAASILDGLHNEYSLMPVGV